MLSLYQSPRKYTCCRQPVQVSLFCLKAESTCPSVCKCKQVSFLTSAPMSPALSSEVFSLHTRSSECLG